MVPISKLSSAKLTWCNCRSPIESLHMIQGEIFNRPSKRLGMMSCGIACMLNVDCKVLRSTNMLFRTK